MISAARSTRQSIIPLWADAQGIDAATTSIIFGISAGVDMLLFYPGGAIMDRFGRVWVAVPSMIVLGLGFALLPLTSNASDDRRWSPALMGLGNGISAGIVLTLGADLAPAGERAQFLGGWRLCADLGNTLGPFVISAVTVRGQPGRRRLDHVRADLAGFGLAGQVGAGVRTRRRRGRRTVQ